MSSATAHVEEQLVRFIQEYQGNIYIYYTYIQIKQHVIRENIWLYL